ncbi:MAG: isocitrate/isopropylmalate family dehydrogenase [Planctomycetota bacterium]|nr:isocitrate/isopropylmalate family dehydrogenase [Planctomycetota bacterium]
MDSQPLEIASPASKVRSFQLGVIEGEGVGREVIAAAMDVLKAVEVSHGLNLTVKWGPGNPYDGSRAGTCLSSDAEAFHAEIAVAGAAGAVLTGPVRGRFVYDLRRRFDIYYKLIPIVPMEPLIDETCWAPGQVRGVDVLIVRDNIGGVYQGSATTHVDLQEGRVVEHAFTHSEAQVSRFLGMAAAQARRRRGLLTVVVKDGGVEEVSALWKELASAAGAAEGVKVEFINVDHAGYRLLRHPREFDVVACSNMIGDIIGDLGGVLVGSRGLTYSGNFSSSGWGVYQTNHGAAFDLAGRDIANPAGQILALAMLLETSVGQPAAAQAIRQALTDTWRDGWHTVDVARPGARHVGTKEFARKVCERLRQPAESSGRR